MLKRYGHIKKTAALLPLLLSGCGYHYLTPSNKPENLSSLRIETPNNESYFSITLKRELEALNINTKLKNGPLLVIKTLRFQHPQPNLFNSGVSRTMIYSLTASWQLQNEHNKAMTPIMVTQQNLPIIHNANQFDTPSMQPLAYHTLSKRLVQLILYRVSAYFSAHPNEGGKHHATQS